jgi:hypothetical protein
MIAPKCNNLIGLYIEFYVKYTFTHMNYLATSFLHS